MDRKTSSILLLSGLIVFLSLSALLINFFIYQYPANNYFPDGTLRIACTLVLFYSGILLLVGKKSKFCFVAKELIYFFAVMSLIALATNAAQLTPFSPIDHKIVEFEAFFHIEISALLVWTHNHPQTETLLRIIYDSLNYQLCFIPLFMIAMGRFHAIRDYYFLLLLTTFIGFTFYYFYPTTAPASVINSPYFTSYQMDTGLKFHQLHNHIPPSTIEGGLIALPSFHCIWALLCVYLLKEWFIPCLVLLLINLVLIASCVLIGWHYPSDIVAGFLLVMLSYLVLKKTNATEFSAVTSINEMA